MPTTRTCLATTSDGDLSTTVVEKIQPLLSPRHRQHYLLYSFFLVGEHGSYNQAFPLLDLSGITPTRRRMKALEGVLGVTLITSDSNGSSLTPDGRKVFLLIRPTFTG